MRILFLFFAFVFISTPPFLEGDYEASGGMVGASWHFTKDGLFTYYEANCEGGRNGFGNYEIKNDSVYFNFKSFPETQHLQVTSAKSADNTNGNWEINMHLRDAASAEGLPFVLVKLSDTSGTVLVATQTDLDGNAKLKVENYKGKITVTALYPGYDKAETILAQPGNYQVSIGLYIKDRPVHIENEQRKYKLVKNEKEEIIFQTEYAEQDKKAIAYKIALRRTANNREGIYRKEIENIPTINPAPKPQMPEGYFNNATEYGDGEEFYFGKNNSFSYLWNCSDCGSRSGSGIYSLNKDTLCLRFMPTCKVDNLWMLNGRTSIEANTNDSTFILCAIEAGEADPFLFVQLCDSAGTNWRSLTKDKNGFYSFGIKSTEINSLFLHINSPGYNEEWLALNTITWPVQIILTKGEYRIPPWTVDKYKVVFAGKNKIELVSLQKGSSGGIPVKFFRGTIR